MKRLLLKISGEALMGDSEYGISTQTLSDIADKVVALQKTGVSLCLVLGGGNIFRGVSTASKGMDRSTADYMGMLATVMNALAFQNALVDKGVDAKVFSALEMPKICDSYTQRDASDALNAGKVVIFTAGVGSPYFSTDTAAALRAIEMGCDAIVKATKVSGLYDKDPQKCDDAVFIKQATYQEVLTQNLQVMDMTAISLAKENHMPVMICNINEDDIFLKLMNNEGQVTLIKD